MCTIVGNKCDTALNKIRSKESANFASPPPPQAPAASPGLASVTARVPEQQYGSKVPTRPNQEETRRKAEMEADKYFGVSEPLSEDGEPISKNPGPAKVSILQQMKLQAEKQVQVSPQSVSKYMEIKPKSASNLPTDEAIVDEDEWTKAYIQVTCKPNS